MKEKKENKEKESVFNILEDECVTIVGMNHYYGGSIIERGVILRCEKEPDNEKDHEAIMVSLPVVKKVGYIANNTFTVKQGTQSAGRIYDKVADVFYVITLFCDDGTAIAKILREDEKVLEKRWREDFFNTEKKSSKK